MGETTEGELQATEHVAAAHMAPPAAEAASLSQLHLQACPWTDAGASCSPGGGSSRGHASSGSDSSSGLLNTPQPAPCSRAEQSVLSPTPSPTAACLPSDAACGACADSPQPEGSAATGSWPQADGGGVKRLSPRAAELQRQVFELQRLHSFVRCLARSALLPSALLYLEMNSQHPPVAGGAASPAGLEWTVAQLLALFLRSGEKAASEVSLVAALWVLESAHDSCHSSATNVLVRYIKLIGAFFPEVALGLQKDWPAAYKSMRAQLVKGQLQLLTGLRWRTHLTLDTDVEPCYRLLFGQPADAAACPPTDASCASGVKAGSHPVLQFGRLAASKQAHPTLSDLEALLVSLRADLQRSMHSMATTLKNRVSMLQRALLGQPNKDSLWLSCAAEAKRRRTE